jgi:hypothetical protein
MPMNTAVETEAELQARLEGRLRAALPLLPAEIRLERHLHLRLGHHVIDIDGLSGDPKETRGRYDFLVLANGNPLLMVELKAPEVDVTDEDVRQALSYARLHEPIVPLVLVTNGPKTVLRRYDGHELQPGDVAVERLDSILASASSLAASVTEDAVRTLLGSSRQVWSQMLATWNREAVSALTGGIRDLKCPIAQSFVFKRQACKQVAERLARGERLLVVHGPPLSGVTNALAQIAGDASLGSIAFIDGKACSDLLQFVANRMSRELSFGISKDHLRGWLNTVGKLAGITLVVDGLPRDGVDELVEYATSGILKLVLGIDSETFRRISTVPGRAQESQLGRTASRIELEPLSDEEFYGALEVLDEACDALFFNGAQHSPQLRWPRALRVLAASLPTKKPALEVAGSRVSKVMLGPIAGPVSLKAFSRAFATEPSLKFDLRSLAQAYLNDVDQHATDPDWLVTTWGRPSIDPGIVEDEVGEARIERLRLQLPFRQL